MDISDIVLQSYLDAFETGELSDSQKQGVITLVPKQGKNLTDLKSWRPISVLNTDYKILAKVLATRLKMALPEIINSDQIGYMQGRFCGENVRLISDIIDYCSFNKKPGLILLADFEKAFNTVNLSFMKFCLKKYGFGKNFQKWISTLYKNIVSCVTNNGHQSQYFKLTRGIRQGCPLSALLFLLIAEVIANNLRTCDNVSGIKVNNSEIKLCQFPDDMTLLMSDMQSLQKALVLFEEFYQYAGLKLNKNKTEAIIIYNGGNLKKDTNYGIKWLNESFSTLGITFFLNSSKTILA